MAQPTTIPPHVIILPFPLQGHVTSMLKLSELLCLAGIHVTFLITQQNHARLLRSSNVLSRFSSYPRFQFQKLPESVSDGNAQAMGIVMNLYESLKSAKSFFRNLLSGEGQKPVTCVIVDGVMKYTLDVAEEVGVPIIYFRTISACSFWAYFCMPTLVETGEFPFKGDDMDIPIKNVAGMESFLRRRDLPSLFRVADPNNNSFKMWSSETHETIRAQALILNTCDDLEGPILAHIRTKIPNIYTIGPLHAHLKARLDVKTTSELDSSNGFWKEDKSCIKWLDEQPLKSVIYVSFGSIAVVTRDQLMEIWHGLVNSGKQFLWVIRPDSIAGTEVKKQNPPELEEGTKARGYMVEWAPQEAVLAHPAVGGFLTHSGWNSTLESIYAGVPMICWPYFADQQINSRFVGEVWKLGLDIKDTCDRVIIEKAIRDLMETKKEEFLKSAHRMARLANESVHEGGSSHCNLDKLIQDIKLMTQGHVTSMLKLSELLCLAGIHVTYLITKQNHTRILRSTDVLSRFSRYDGFRFQELPGSVSDGNAQAVDIVMNLYESLKTVKPFFRSLLSGEGQKPVTCVITDGIMSFTLDVAQDIGVPIFYFRTISACAFWAYFCMPTLVETGEFPFKGDDMNNQIKNIPGMEDFLRRRDLPSMYRVTDTNDYTFKMLSSETRETVRAHALILNTYEDLEGTILSHIRSRITNIYSIGPLHAHLKARLDVKTASELSSSSSFWEEDRSCIKWLDGQPFKSVIYVSFGSIAMVTRDQLLEFWHGVVNSGKRFLWVIRPDSVAGTNIREEIPVEVEDGTRARGYIVEWAPQEEVLAHPAVGGFLTHSGWNSTLESIYEGVPMICWPYFADQQINSRYVEEVWKLGLDIKDTCDRVIIEKAVRDLMEMKKEEFLKSAHHMANLANKSVHEGGSSHCNLDRLIEDIKMMSLASQHN